MDIIGGLPVDVQKLIVSFVPTPSISLLDTLVGFMKEDLNLDSGCIRFELPEDKVFDTYVPVTIHINGECVGEKFIFTMRGSYKHLKHNCEMMDGGRMWEEEDDETLPSMPWDRMFHDSNIVHDHWYNLPYVVHDFM